jgi:hypothetical protein
VEAATNIAVEHFTALAAAGQAVPINRLAKGLEAHR